MENTNYLKNIGLGRRNFIYEYFSIKREIDEFYGNNYTHTEEDIDYFIGIWCCFDIDYKEYNHKTGSNLTASEYNGKKVTLRNIAKKIDESGGYEELLNKMKDDLNQRKEKRDTREIYGQHVSNYNDYLQTDYWKDLRQLALERDGNCKLCNDDIILQAHHRSYKNKWGKEKELNDLVILCKRCHELFHNNVKL